MTIGNDEAQVIRTSLFSTQVCVPEDWTDQQVLDFTEKKNPCGTENGWRIRREFPERVQCEHPARVNFVHLMLDA